MLFKEEAIAWKLLSDFKEQAKAHNTRGIIKNKIKPDIRCSIDTIAGNGKDIVVKSRLTGRFLFTLSASPLISQ